MNKIQRVSIFFRIVFQLLFILAPLIVMAAWIYSPQSLINMSHGIINLNFIPKAYVGKILHELTNLDKLLGFCVSTIPLIVELYILYALIKLFSLYEKGDIFSINNVCYIRHIGYGLLTSQLVNPVYELLMGFVLTRNNPPGHRFASITLDQTNIEILCAALIVILISWIMAEGCKLREEHQLTI